MKYRILWISVFLIGCIAFGFLANHELIQYRYHQIDQEVLAYQKAEKISYTEALEHYKKAKNVLNNFLKRFPLSTESKSFKDNKTLLGGIKLNEFQNLEPNLINKAKAEKDLFDCSYLLAKNIETDTSGEIYFFSRRDIKDQMANGIRSLRLRSSKRRID